MLNQPKVQEDDIAAQLASLVKLIPWIKWLVVGSFLLGTWITALQMNVNQIRKEMDVRNTESTATAATAKDDHEAIIRLQGAVTQLQSDIAEIKSDVKSLLRAK